MFHFSTRNALLPSAAMTILLGLSACGGGGGSDDTSASASAAAAAGATAGTASGAAAGAAAGTVTTNPTPQPALPTKALGLTDQRASATPGTVRLVAFDIATPNTVTSVPITTAAGVGSAAFAANEWIFGMDYRPADGLLWGLTNRGRLYTIDPATGVATFKVALVADPADTTSAFAGLEPAVTSVSVDFNPVVNLMRVVGFGGQNLRINVDTGATITDTDVPAFAIPAVAYGNSFTGATATTLHGIDSSTDNKITQNPPNDGVIVQGGALGLNISEVVGMDIAGSTDQLVLGALRVGSTGPHSLYNINLSTGAAVLRPVATGSTAVIGGPTGLPLVDIAIRP